MKQSKTMTYKEKAKVIEDLVNGSFNDISIAAHLSTMHRYLQNSLFKMFWHYCNILARNYDKGFYDGRNEWACETAKKMIEAAEPSATMREYYYDSYDEALNE